jgi:hypothetical protein
MFPHCVNTACPQVGEVPFRTSDSKPHFIVAIIHPILDRTLLDFAQLYPQVSDFVGLGAQITLCRIPTTTTHRPHTINGRRRETKQQTQPHAIHGWTRKSSHRETHPIVLVCDVWLRQPDLVREQHAYHRIAQHACMLGDSRRNTTVTSSVNHEK